jgi:hypothetical protein
MLFEENASLGRLLAAGHFHSIQCDTALQYDYIHTLTQHLQDKDNLCEGLYNELILYQTFFSSAIADLPHAKRKSLLSQLTLERERIQCQFFGKRPHNAPKLTKQTNEKGSDFDSSFDEMDWLVGDDDLNDDVTEIQNGPNKD